MVSLLVLLLPLEGESTNWPHYLHVTVNMKLIAAFVLGMAVFSIRLSVWYTLSPCRASYHGDTQIMTNASSPGCSDLSVRCCWEPEVQVPVDSVMSTVAKIHECLKLSLSLSLSLAQTSQV